MKNNVLWMNVLLSLVLLLATDMGQAQMTTAGGRAPNEYTATVTPDVVAQTGQAIPFSLMLMNVSPAREGGCGDDHNEGGCGDDHDDGGCGDDHDDGGCGDDHDDGGCGDDHDDGGCGDDHDDGGCGDDHDDGGCGDDHDDGGCGDDHDDGGCGDDHDDGGCGGETSEPGSMAIKKITLWLPQGITIADLRNIDYYTMPCDRQWMRTELEATDRIVFVAQHGRAHRLGRDQAFVLTFSLLSSYTGELQWITELSHCPGKGGRAFQLVTMPGHQYTDAHPTTMLYTPGRDLLAGGGHIITTQSHGSHAPADGTPLNFMLSARTLKQRNNLLLRGLILFSYSDQQGNRWYFQSNELLGMGVDNIFGPQAKAGWIAARGKLSSGKTVLYNVVLQATLVDRGVPGKGDEVAFTLRQNNILLLSTHWQDKTTISQPLTRGNILILGGGTPAGVVVLKSDTPELMPETVNTLQITAYPNPFREKLHFRFTPSEDAPVLLQLYDMSGRLITTLVEEYASAGELYEVDYVAQLENTGMIIYRLIVGEQIQTGKVLYQR